MPFTLKPGQESFEVVDGPHAGKQYKKGVAYDQIPEQDEDKFTSTNKAKKPAKNKPMDPVDLDEAPAKKKEQ